MPIRQLTIGGVIDMSHKEKFVGTRFTPSRVKQAFERTMRDKYLVSRMPIEEWERILKDFNYCCAYCGTKESRNSRLIPDHLIPQSRNGDLVSGNCVPACGRCNDSKSKFDENPTKTWEDFVRHKFPEDAEKRILEIKQKIGMTEYKALPPEARLTQRQLAIAVELKEEFEKLYRKLEEYYNS